MIGNKSSLFFSQERTPRTPAANAEHEKGLWFASDKEAADKELGEDAWELAELLGDLRRVARG